jgi:2-amino-4-hydroxy-6-hydroxymethyldihydropteridine diphosphokinase
MGGETAARPLRHAGCAGAQVKSKVQGPRSKVGLRAFVALGSNLGDSVQIVRCAIERLQQLSADPPAASSLWQSPPVDCPAGSPDFINAVVGLTPGPGETPESLLAGLQAIEREFGRAPKKVVNEPRSLDLDLIAFAGEVRTTRELTLPHPRAHLRRFVLQPLGEIAPDLVLPGQTRTVAQLLATLPSDDTMRRLT